MTDVDAPHRQRLLELVESATGRSRTDPAVMEAVKRAMAATKGADVSPTDTELDLELADAHAMVCGDVYSPEMVCRRSANHDGAHAAHAANNHSVPYARWSA